MKTLATVLITVISHYGGASPAALHKIERAVTDQSKQLRVWWHTPIVKFGPGSHFTVTIDKGLIGGISSAYNGVHYMSYYPTPTVQGASPVAEVAGAPGWQGAFSHEVIEALVDPDGSGVEICDPVQMRAYVLDGQWVSAFVTPWWFLGRLAPRGVPRWIDRPPTRRSTMQRSRLGW